MNCEIIKDLIPLYIDGCCSEESRKTVKEHIDGCKKCRELFDDMSIAPDILPVCEAPKKFNRINDWKASVLQSVLLFISFALITAGVAIEANTPLGLTNGLLALNLVVPVTGFMLSLANWYFVRLYKTKKAFSVCSLFITLGITLSAYIWVFAHYEADFSDLFSVTDFAGFQDIMQGILFFYGIGFVLTFVFCVLSKVLSDKYARMLGKE